MLAGGDFIVFVDSDDVVKPDLIKYLYDLITDGDCRIAVCTYSVVYPDGVVVNYGNGNRELLLPRDCIECMCYDDLVQTSA